MPTGASRDTVQTAIRQANFEDQIRILNQSLKWDPLNYLLYYQRGIVQMERASTIGNTMSDFRKALFLEQTAPQIPDLIQQACRQCALPQADEIRKEVTRFTIARDSNLFRNYYDPKIDSLNDKGRSTLAQGNPEMEALAVLLQQPGDFDVWLSALLADNEPLKGVMPGTQKELFDRWAAQGDCAKLVNEWPDHPNWRLFGAKAHLMALARLNRIPEAVSSALEILKPKKLPDIAPGTDLEQTEREFQFNHDVYDGIQAYLALEKAGEKDHAKSVLQQVAVMPGCPDYVHYLLGQGFHNEGNNEEAWKSLYPLVVNL
jgi:hypothetical protein